MSTIGARPLVKYHFYKVSLDWRRLSSAERTAQKAEFKAAYEGFAETAALWSYSLIGIRGDADLLIRQYARTLEEMHALGALVAGSRLGAYLETPYSYLAVTRQSPYSAGHRHAGQEGSLDPKDEPPSKYLVVYPFVKSRAWYSLSQANREAMMGEHFKIGHRYPSIRIHTSYSFGIDDQEFVVAFDIDDPAEFVDLVMELRSSEASSFTVRDVPAFTCIAMPIGRALDALDEDRAAEFVAAAAVPGGEHSR